MTVVLTTGLWKVTGTRAYRGNEPGEEFEAAIPSSSAARAVARGDVALLEEFTPTVPEDHQLPEGWNG